MLWFLACAGTGSADTAPDFVVADSGGSADTSAADAPPEVAVSVSSLDFGRVALGDIAARSLVISNNGPGDLRLWSVALDGDGAFDLGAMSRVLVEPYSSVDAEVAFEPEGSGLATATLQIATNDPADPTVSIGIRGVGAGDGLELSPERHDFGSVGLDCTVSQTLWVTNLGSGAVYVGSVGFQAGDSEIHLDLQSSINGALPWTLGAGRSAQLLAIYSPTDEQADEAVVLVGSEDEGVGATLTGVGLPRADDEPC